MLTTGSGILNLIQTSWCEVIWKGGCWWIGVNFRQVGWERVAITLADVGTVSLKISLNCSVQIYCTVHFKHCAFNNHMSLNCICQFVLSLHWWKTMFQCWNGWACKENVWIIIHVGCSLHYTMLFSCIVL